MYKIKKNVPLPGHGNSRGFAGSLPLAAMEVGDMFSIEFNVKKHGSMEHLSNQLRGAVHSYPTKVGTVNKEARFKVRKISEIEMGVWRVK